MIAVANEMFKLTPDWTLPVQTAIFVLAVFALSYLVFSPIRRIIERRREFTTEAKREAETLVAEAGQLDEGRREVLAMALTEAQAERAKRLAEAHRVADSTVAAARESSRDIISEAAKGAEATRASLDIEAGGCAEEIAEAMAERIAH
ncbi:MAG: hypothetical protein JXA24_02160 [Proteobacteria bacterium]|nr:hypothetical protein [Pseudomonadota bacterium]